MEDFKVSIIFINQCQIMVTDLNWKMTTSFNRKSIDELCYAFIRSPLIEDFWP
jgi:hypothetical protein